MCLKKKVDFVLLVSVYNANPNGDPLNGNRPRTDYDEIGEITDVCVKRKIRNRMMDLGKNVFVQSDDRANDGFFSLKARAEAKGIGKKIADNKNKEQNKTKADSKIACETWLDVRTFGQVFALNGSEGNISIGVRGPVSVQIARSVDPVDVVSMQITKSVSNEDGDKRGPDTMGMKHFVRYGLYVIKGSINPVLAEKTGFSDEDADVVKECLRTLFDNDASSARPEGSIVVEKLYWFEQKAEDKKISSRNVHNSVVVKKKEGIETPRAFDDYIVTRNSLDNLVCEELEGN